MLSAEVRIFISGNRDATGKREGRGDYFLIFKRGGGVKSHLGYAPVLKYCVRWVDLKGSLGHSLWLGMSCFPWVEIAASLRVL